MDQSFSSVPQPMKASLKEYMKARPRPVSSFCCRISRFSVQGMPSYSSPAFRCFSGGACTCGLLLGDDVPCRRRRRATSRAAGKALMRRMCRLKADCSPVVCLMCASHSLYTLMANSPSVRCASSKVSLARRRMLVLAPGELAPGELELPCLSCLHWTLLSEMPLNSVTKACHSPIAPRMPSTLQGGVRTGRSARTKALPPTPFLPCLSMKVLSLTWHFVFRSSTEGPTLVMLPCFCI
mmetsp:Transcript_6511/g.24283  ORF Transcript_6511/g.24283 Transcript_6511/m.24283 type:complete len:238 (-) Transcript_6511:825-1538(-)